MKKLIKSDICGSVNSTRMHCSWLKKSAFTAESKKKKKKVETRFAPIHGRKTHKPNIHSVSFPSNFSFNPYLLLSSFSPPQKKKKKPFSSLPLFLLYHGCFFCNSCAFLTMVLCHNLQFTSKQSQMFLVVKKRKTHFLASNKV